jgi:hypothetical protein
MATAAPQTAMEMPQEAAPNPFSDPNTMAVYDQMRQTVSPKEFSDEMLAGASQIDPQAMAQFRDELSQIDLSPEDLDMLNNMVDEILANPERYAEVRAKYIEMGTPEELLPEQFDPQFFAAMNMAIEQLIGEPAGVQAFAQGGIAELKPIAKAIASYGRNGDTMLAHITPAEARMLRRRGGSGTINPDTGLPEFFLKKAFKSLGKAIKSFASSTVGKIVTTVALGFFLGPAAASFMGVGSAAGVAAVSGFVGSAGSTLLAGGNLKDALKAGAVGGLTAGAGAGVMGGSEAFQAGSYTGPTTVSGQIDKLTGMVKAPPFPEYTAQGALTDNATSNAAREAYAGELYKTNPEAFYNPAPAPVSPLPLPGQPGSDVLVGGKPSISPAPLPGQPGSDVLVGGKPAIPVSGNPLDATEFQGSLAKPPVGVAPPTDPSYFDQAKDFYKNNLSPSGIQAQAEPLARQAATDAVAAAEKTIPASITGEARSAMLKTAYDSAFKAAMPGIVGTYGPMAAAGIGALALTGGFKPTDAAESTLKPELMKPVTQRIAEGGNQRNFYIQGLPGVKYDQYGAPIFGQNVPLPTFDTGLGISSLMPKGYADGGIIGVGYAAGGAVTAANFDSTAYLNANQDVKDAIARGEIKDAYEHYTKFGKAEGRTAFDKAETAAKTAADAAALETKQAADRKAVADATAARKAAGFGNAYQNINAGLSYDVPAGIAATSIAARQAAFKPTMDKFTQSQAANAATLAQPYTPRVVAQPYNNVEGYKNVFNPVTTPVNYDTTPELSAAQKAAADKLAADKAAADKAAADAAAKAAADKAAADAAKVTTTVQPPVTTGYTGRPITDQEIKNYLISNPNATDRDLVKIMDQYNVRPDQVARATGMQGVDPSSFQNINFRYADAKSALQNNPNSLARQNQADAVTGKSIQDYFAKNPGMTDAQIANYMDKNMIDPAQMQYAFAGTPGAISSQDVLSRYNAAITGPTRTVFATDSLPTPPAAAGGAMQDMAMKDQLGNYITGPAAGAAAPVEKKLLNMGGIASLGSGGYPRRTGQISGPGTATSDSIPAMLSDGEFVMTAKAVRGAGKGDRRAGAKRMYALMNQLEKNAARG